MTTAADAGFNSPGPGLVQPYENIALHCLLHTCYAMYANTCDKEHLILSTITQCNSNTQTSHAHVNRLEIFVSEYLQQHGIIVRNSCLSKLQMTYSKFTYALSIFDIIERDHPS